MKVLLNLLLIENQNHNHPANIYLFNVNERNTRKRCEICSTLTIKSPERRCSGDFIVTLNNFTPFSSVSIVEFEQVNISWKVAFLAVIYLFRVNNKNTRTMCAIRSDLTIMTLEWCQ